ncbi:multidrug resistance-associated protein 5 [Tanacetum coccineum]
MATNTVSLCGEGPIYTLRPPWARGLSILGRYDNDDDSDYQSDKSVDYLSPSEEELIELRTRIKANREAKAKAKDNPCSEINEPNDENSIHTDNVRGETFEDHDIYMNELLKSPKTTDKDEITGDPFISVEKHVERRVRVVAKCGQRPPRLSDPKKDSNPGSTVKLGVLVNPDDQTYFDRFYVCFVGLADGWKAGCRKIIALDGCFLKSSNQGKILTAIGRDENNHIYPVAWAVVILELLEEDLGCNRGNGLTMMSDQHTGLMEAVKDVMPNAKHRQCARHKYPGLEFRQLFWVASKALYPQLFNKIMDKIKAANPNAHKYLIDTNPRPIAFFEVDRGCESIENGFSECFNSVIVSVRHKPLLTMLKAIRVIVLERMNKMREISRKWNLRVCPNIKKRLEWLKEQQRFRYVIPAGGNLFEVRSGSEGFTVVKGKKDLVPESNVSAWFETHMYFVAYHNFVKPVPSMNFWPDQSMYSTVLPLKPKKISGLQASYSNYKKPQHNKASCKEPIVEQIPKPKGVPGRPRKKQSVGDLEDANVGVRGLVRDEGAGGSKGGAGGSQQGSVVAGGSKRGAGAAGSKKGCSGGSKQSSAGGSKGGAGASRSKRKAMSSAETQKRHVGTTTFPP